MYYPIYEGNVERLTKKLNRIKNKCEKYGCDFRFEQVGEEVREYTDEDGNKTYTKYIIVDVEGIAIVNDWKFVASVEHTANGNIIRAACDIKVPDRYYTSAPICEHCNSKRVRKDTYIVMNTKTGEFKQVGRSCLADFTNGMNAQGVAEYTSLFDELIVGEAPYTGIRVEPYYKTEKLLQYAAEAVRHWGYTKVSREMPVRDTKSRVIDYYRLDNNGRSYGELRRKELQDEIEEVGYNPESPEAVKAASDALAWIKNQPENSDYIHNLKVLCSLDYVSEKDVGILVSIFPTKERQEKSAREHTNSGYVGEIKQRITVDIQSIECVTSWITEYGVTRIYKITDSNNNVFTWKTGNLIESSAKKITGTVKAHNEFRGTKQTELTRCKLN